jgi:uncharacterized protein (DUF302 family)
MNDTHVKERNFPMTPAGLTVLPSAHTPSDTMDRVVSAVKKRGITVMARIDHAAAAAQVGMNLRATEVLIFGNPKSGTPLMQASQTIGIDLPLKILVWEDEQAKTWLAYNDLDWLAARHGITGEGKVLNALAAGLAAIAKEAK